MSIRIVMADAGAGDSFAVRIDGQQAPWLAVIDGGPPGTPDRALLAVLKWVTKDVRSRGHYLDLLAVTHVDKDHIGGAIDLLTAMRDGTLDLQIGEVWHNSFEALTGDNRVIRNIALRHRTQEMATRHPRLNLSRDSQVIVASIDQGIQLHDLLDCLGISRPTELLTQGDAFEWERGPSIRVLGPTTAEVERLRRHWEQHVNQQWNETLAATSAAQAIDQSVTNLSSLVFMLEHERQRVLFTGDARGDRIVQRLGEGGLLDTRGRIKVDALKVPHHGSERSCTTGLFETVIADHYLISGDGTNDNPSVETARRLAIAVGNRSAVVWLTHPLRAVVAALDRAPNLGVKWRQPTAKGVEIAI